MDLSWVLVSVRGVVGSCLAGHLLAAAPWFSLFIWIALSFLVFFSISFSLTKDRAENLKGH